ncbi:hypothetical protein CMK12_10710 [Candidatus Poribacteria bacterium]|nr:hypothetical protein [Candidatus Poribacteria bacterium]
MLYLYTGPYNMISLLTRLPVVALPLMFVESDCVDAIFPIENRYPLEKIKYANWVWRSLLTVWLE